tara:strand:+ start:1054 stop:1281 length:228 start_codon:yes stop_codon:yes gene_type:complete
VLSFFLLFIFIKKNNPGTELTRAENVKINPTLVAISGLTVVFAASVKNTYSLIPIPPKEKIDKTDEIKKIYKKVK